MDPHETPITASLELLNRQLFALHHALKDLDLAIVHVHQTVMDYFQAMTDEIDGEQPPPSPDQPM